MPQSRGFSCDLGSFSFVGKASRFARKPAVRYTSPCESPIPSHAPRRTQRRVHKPVYRLQDKHRLSAWTVASSRWERSKIRMMMVCIGGPKRRWSDWLHSTIFAGWLMDTPLPPDFKEFLVLLNSAKIEYLIVGGYAVSDRGCSPRLWRLRPALTRETGPRWLPDAKRLDGSLTRYFFAHEMGGRPRRRSLMDSWIHRITRPFHGRREIINPAARRSESGNHRAPAPRAKTRSRHHLNPGLHSLSARVICS